MKQIRLEALRLALCHKAEPAETLSIAQEYANYIANGEKVVQLEQPVEVTEEIQSVEAVPPAGSRRQRRSRKHR